MQVNLRLADPSGCNKMSRPPRGGGEPNLYVVADDQVYLSWIEAAGEKSRALLFAVRSGAGGRRLAR